MAYTTTAAPQAPSTPPKIKPSAGWIGLGIALIAAGVIGAIVLFVVGFFRMTDTIEGFGRFQFEPDTQWAVEFDNAGTYTIYYEWESKIDGDSISGDRDPPRGLEITVTDESGEEVDLSGRGMDESYELPDFSGEALYEIEIEDGGTYTFSVETREENPEDFAIAIGKGALASIVPFALGGVGVGLLGVVAGALLIIITSVKRRRRKQAAMAAASAYAPGYGGYAAPGWGPPPGAPGWTGGPPAAEAPAPWAPAPPAAEAPSPWAPAPPAAEPSPWAAPAPAAPTAPVAPPPPTWSPPSSDDDAAPGSPPPPPPPT